jgi:hypothetical protein
MCSGVILVHWFVRIFFYMLKVSICNIQLTSSYNFCIAKITLFLDNTRVVSAVSTKVIIKHSCETKDVSNTFRILMYILDKQTHSMNDWQLIIVVFK